AVAAAAETVRLQYRPDGGAHWNSSYTAPTTDGSYTLSVRDTDVAGNQATTTLNFTLDTTISQPTLSLATDSGSSSSDHLTNDGKIGRASCRERVNRED